MVPELCIYQTGYASIAKAFAMGIARSLPCLAQCRDIFIAMCVGSRFRIARGEKKYTHSTHADITLTLQPALSLDTQSALAFRECHSFLLVGSLRFNVCASSFVRALRLVDLPKFIRGRTFERSSVKKFAMLRRCDTFLVLLHCCL